MRKGWKKIKDKVLGKKYDLSVVVADSRTMKKLNETYRKKKGPANVLSFPLSKDMGEIFINKKANQKDFLFIHSLLHLKGLKHGKIMEREEQKIWRAISSQA
ncbi:MAG: rRNA maturation RNAse YbeY [Candidatus Parcubacteria bacterium]|nr:rRNA maturation RNAse YbeY [Candidatus Parcubacteria bacterium]